MIDFCSKPDRIEPVGFAKYPLIEQVIRHERTLEGSVVTA
jgi:hypothetical protein